MLKVYPPGTRKGNRWCIIKGRLNGRAIERTLKGITDPEEGRSIAREYSRAAAETARPDERSDAGHPQTFRELAERYAADRRISRHECAYINRLVCIVIKSRGQVLGDISIAELVPAIAREAAISIYGHRTAATMNRAGISPFSAIVHFGAENQWMPYLRIKPFRQIRRVTPRLAYGEDDVQRLLEAAAAAKPRKCDRYKREHPKRR